MLEAFSMILTIRSDYFRNQH